MIINDKEGTVYIDNSESTRVGRSLISSSFDTLKEEYEAIQKDISDNKDNIEKIDKDIDIIENNIVGLLDIDLNILNYLHMIEERTTLLKNNQDKIVENIDNIDLELKALKSYTENIATEEWFLEMKRNARRYYFKNLFNNYQYQIYAILLLLVFGGMILLAFIF